MMLWYHGKTIYKLLIVCQCIYMTFCAAHFRATERTKCRSSKHILKHIVKVSINECVQQCRARQKCAFLNYRRRHLLCELYTDGDGAEMFITNSVPCEYVSRDDIQNSKIVDTCGCSDNETCDVNTRQCSVTECEYKTDLGLLTTQGNMNGVGSRWTYKLGPWVGTSYNVTECMNTGLWNPLLSKSIYSYQGCYEDIESRALRDMFTHEAHMTLDMCSKRCSGSTYIGLQYYTQCFCGSTLYLDVPVTETECNLPCGGNHSQMCGGVWRNSIYKLIMI